MQNHLLKVTAYNYLKLCSKYIYEIQISDLLIFKTANDDNSSILYNSNIDWCEYSLTQKQQIVVSTGTLLAQTTFE